ncbi:MAG: ferrous iron transport protein A [Candidatus Omnitrophica bacterium]|nr:ferrous iron transport protein A [Candidatus Omnitrophota bacterium]
MKRVSLVELEENKKGKVVEILGGMGAYNKLVNMGVCRGKEITKLSHIGLRGPVVIKVGSSRLALGRGLANKVIVETEA